MASKNKTTIPTRAQGPSKIPQDVQQDIVELAVLLNVLDRAAAAYDRKKDQIAEKLMGAVEVRS